MHTIKYQQNKSATPSVYALACLRAEKEGYSFVLSMSLAAAEDWCEDAGRTLEPARCVCEQPVGSNTTVDCLVEFLASVSVGRVAAGSILLIETLIELPPEEAESASFLLNKCAAAGISVIEIATI